MLKVCRSQATLCCLFLAVCVAASWPVAETGMYDDWSYIRTVETFARTGHVVFNGWGAPLLGIQLLPAALLVKMFGFSYTLVRLTTVLVALGTTALVQRTLVRCGVEEWNASIATITLMTSPMFLPVVTSFITDVWCLCAIVVCLYCCLRSLTARSDSKAIAWVCSAALGNAVLGTSRQIAWVGVLVMVPSTLWLLRTRRRVVAAGAVGVASGWVVIAASMMWFAHHPYTLPEHFGFHGVKSALRHPSIFLRPLLEIPLLVLPMLLMFLPGVVRSDRKGRYVSAAGFAVFCLLAGYGYHLHTLQNWYAPFVRQIGSIFSPFGVYYLPPVWGERPPALPGWLRAGWSLLTIAGLLAWLSVTFGGPRRDPEAEKVEAISWRQLGVLLTSFAAGYTLLLMPRALKDLTIDRYLEPLLLVALIFLCRQYQDLFRSRLPRVSMVLAVVVAGYSVLTLQDCFANYRAVLAAANEVVASGVPRSQFDGGWEYDGLTQVIKGGYVHQGGIRLPEGQLLYGHRRSGPCEVPIDVWLPDVEPAYALSYSRDGCGGATSFAPVTYRRLLWPHTITLYIVKDPDLTGKHGLFPTF